MWLGLNCRFAKHKHRMVPDSLEGRSKAYHYPRSPRLLALTTSCEVTAAIISQRMSEDGDL